MKTLVSTRLSRTGVVFLLITLTLSGTSAPPEQTLAPTRELSRRTLRPTGLEEGDTRQKQALIDNLRAGNPAAPSPAPPSAIPVRPEPFDSAVRPELVEGRTDLSAPPAATGLEETIFQGTLESWGAVLSTLQQHNPWKVDVLDGSQDPPSPMGGTINIPEIDQQGTPYPLYQVALATVALNVQSHSERIHYEVEILKGEPGVPVHRTSARVTVYPAYNMPISGLEEGEWKELWTFLVDLWEWLQVRTEMEVEKSAQGPTRMINVEIIWEGPSATELQRHSDRLPITRDGAVSILQRILEGKGFKSTGPGSYGPLFYHETNIGSNTFQVPAGMEGKVEATVRKEAGPQIKVWVRPSPHETVVWMGKFEQLGQRLSDLIPQWQTRERLRSLIEVRFPQHIHLEDSEERIKVAGASFRLFGVSGPEDPNRLVPKIVEEVNAQVEFYAPPGTAYQIVEILWPFEVVEIRPILSASSPTGLEEAARIGKGVSGRGARDDGAGIGIGPTPTPPQWTPQAQTGIWPNQEVSSQSPLGKTQTLNQNSTTNPPAATTLIAQGIGLTNSPVITAAGNSSLNTSIMDRAMNSRFLSERTSTGTNDMILQKDSKVNNGLSTGLEEPLPETIEGLFAGLVLPEGYDQRLVHRTSYMLRGMNRIETTSRLLGMPREEVEELRQIGPTLMSVIDFALARYDRKLLSRKELALQSENPRPTGLRVRDLNLSSRAQRGLQKLGVQLNDPAEAVSGVSADDLLNIQNVGIGTVTEIRQKLALNDVYLRGEGPGPPASVTGVREAAERVRAVLEQISSIPTDRLAGIGPTQAKQYADALRVIAQHSPAALRHRLFVLTAPDEPSLLYLYLQSLGILADNVPSDLVRQIQERFGREASLEADYQATDAEQEVLRHAALFAEANIVVLGWGIGGLEDFLERLLASFYSSNAPLAEVRERFNVKQLAADIDLLVKA